MRKTGVALSGNLVIEQWMILAHQTDEYCLVDCIEQAVDIYVELIKDWSS